MISFIRNENMKIYKRKRTWVMIAIALLYVALQIVNLKTAGSGATNNDWRARLEQENAQFRKEATKPDALNIEIKQAEKHIVLNQYYLNKGIPPSTNGWSFAVSQVRNIIFAVSLISIIIAGEIVAAEFVSGTIKLLLTRSASRTKVYISKYAAAILFGLMLSVAGILTSIFLGGFIFGFDGLADSYFYVKNQAVEEVPMLQALLAGYMLNIPFLLITVTLAFMISAAFRSTTFSIVISLLVSLTGFIISIAMDGWSWTKYFVFSHTDLTPYIYGNPSIDGVTLSFSLVFIGIHLAVMYLISYPIFVKRDVV
ncbi:ABC transporter permease subunit [Lysinibacillus sp. CNPSo 3705]|uniref:ABC transporter permease n=1 Tax=Lysinibacillus sp. CNPSo 3705 TaxID=3028148 RepID=UPI00236456B1|nr:ABC transporter permease subunit [Lysinibacillus sp. CNPSo 3705]MDD1505552.1 ABC transporter permease subunit [Lysinibacillus sp. CNPSo 3705]